MKKLNRATIIISSLLIATSFLLFFYSLLGYDENNVIGLIIFFLSIFLGTLGLILFAHYRTQSLKSFYVDVRNFISELGPVNWF